MPGSHHRLHFTSIQVWRYLFAYLTCLLDLAACLACMLDLLVHLARQRAYQWRYASLRCRNDSFLSVMLLLRAVDWKNQKIFAEGATRSCVLWLCQVRSCLAPCLHGSVLEPSVQTFFQQTGGCYLTQINPLSGSRMADEIEWE